VKNIVLTGFMGTGKTAVGKILARRLGLVPVDVDAEIEREQKKTIAEIFGQFGEDGFRDIESTAIEKLSAMKNVVLSTGGGAVLRADNMDALRKNGVIICLAASPETILGRTCESKDRPLLQVDNPLQKIKELYEFRKPYYEKADIIINTDDMSPAQVAEEIIQAIRNRR